MKLPHIYKNHVIDVRKSSRTGKYYLDICVTVLKVATYCPPLQVIYIGSEYSKNKIAYDHDIQHCEKLIDNLIKEKV